MSAAVQDAVLRVWGLGGIPLVVSCAQIRVGSVGVRGPSPVVPGNMEAWMFLLLVSALVYMSSKNMNLT